MPSHISGGTAGAATRFAGSETTETSSKWNASSGPVASVAAVVIGEDLGDRAGDPPALRGRRASAGASASSPATAAKESCHPGSPAAAGFIASVTAAASPSAYQREAGRPASAATSPATPMTPARWIDGPAPASGT